MFGRLVLVLFASMMLTAADGFLNGAQAAPAGRPIIELTGPTMGTRYSVKVVDGSSSPIRLPSDAHHDLQTRINGRLAEINARMSTYDKDSEVSRFNRSAAGDWFAVSLETARVVHTAIEVSKATDGAFDITVAPLLRIWRFGAHADAAELDRRRAEIPNDALIEQTLAKVGYEKLQVRLMPPAIRKSIDAVEIDLSAIAKGYAVDEIGRLLNDAGDYGDWMVEIGGEVVVRGTKPDGTPWRIGIESPTPDRRQIQLVVAPRDSAIASSGDYRNYFEHNGQRYSHTINPHTGRPVEHALAAVTVNAFNCMQADAWATAILVMGPGEGAVWARQRQVAALMFQRNADGTLHQTKTEAFTIDLPATDTTVASSDATNWLGMAAVTSIVFVLALAGMAIGVIISNRRIKGSCGGLAGMQDRHGRSICDACTTPSPECRGENL